MRRLWVLLVTEGLSLKAAPEVYRSRVTCEREAARLVELSKSSRAAPPQEAEAGITTVGRRRICVVPSNIDRVRKGDSLFAGIVLASDGSLMAAPVLHRNKDQSRAWVHSVAEGKAKSRGSEKPGGDTLYRFRERGRTFIAISSSAKVIAPFAALLEAEEGEKTSRTRYEVELSVRYTHALFTTIESEPSLTRQQLESLIDENFPHLSGYQGTPIEFDWTLESFQESGSYSLKLQDPAK